MPSYLSPAKLNLGLSIVGKRPDGYHLLETIFCLIDLFDTIEIELTHTPEISLIEHKQVWSQAEDLSYKAACLLQSYSKVTKGAKIKVIKHIPIGGGLGGGSSNAATVLLALNWLWGLNYSKEKLQSLALKLGADVPFFILGRSALAQGIGEVLSHIAIPQYYFILIQPDFGINTKEIFNNLNYPIGFNKVLPNYQELLHSKTNDLLPIAINLYPQLKTLIDELQLYGEVYMTGSGSTLYLCFSNLVATKKVAKLLNLRYNIYLVKNIQCSPLPS